MELWWSHFGYLCSQCFSLELILLQIHILCLIILEAVGSTFYKIFLRRNFDKKVYYKYYLQYMILSDPVVFYRLVLSLESGTFDEQN